MKFSPLLVVQLSSMGWLACLTSCVSPLTRTVVPPEIYKYASKSNRDIATELPVTEAFDVLTKLKRIEAAPNLTVKPSYRLIADDSSPDVLTLTDPSNSPGFTNTTFRNQVRRPVLRSGHYFSTMTAVAIEEGLDPTAIPALVVGYRPEFNDGVADFIRNSGVGFDIVVGGALNSAGAGTDSNLELALGLGITIPWSDSGAFSIGAMTWREESMDDMGGSLENTEVAMYIGISLGSFNVSTDED
ncbi:MAG: hypothetical protein AAGG01_22255 [Planctomycetota bacterium]